MLLAFTYLPGFVTMYLGCRFLPIRVPEFFHILLNTQN